MRQINRIIIHCSDSHFGDVLAIDRWHKQRGWSGVGYHYVIPNGIIKARDRYNPSKDGIVQVGRKIERSGAHCKGQNGDSIGICIIGKQHFTSQQLIALRGLLRTQMKRYGVGAENVRAHYEFDNHKSCPNIDAGLIRDLVRQE